MQYPSLRLPMMMFGSYMTSWYVKDPKDPSGKKKIKKTKKVTHKRENGDMGFYPSVNHIYDNMRGGGKKLKKCAERLFDEWNACARMWVKDTGWQIEEGEKVVVELTAYFPDHQQRDTHNAFKLMMDAIEGHIYENDKFALPRVMDYYVIEKDEQDQLLDQPHFILNIYLKKYENEILHQRTQEWLGDEFDKLTISHQ